MHNSSIHPSKSQSLSSFWLGFALSRKFRMETKKKMMMISFGFSTLTSFLLRVSNPNRRSFFLRKKPGRNSIQPRFFRRGDWETDRDSAAGKDAVKEAPKRDREREIETSLECEGTRNPKGWKEKAAKNAWEEKKRFSEAVTTKMPTTSIIRKVGTYVGMHVLFYIQRILYTMSHSLISLHLKDSLYLKYQT